MIILHGDHQVSSRAHLVQLIASARASGQDCVELSADELDLAKLRVHINSSSLFGSRQFLIVSGLFSRRPGTAKTQLVSYLENHPELDLLIWEPKQVTAQLKNFSPVQVRRFDLPKQVFAFLSDLSIKSLALALQTSPPELVLHLLAGRLHQRLLVKPASQTAKLIVHLADLEYRYKTGALPGDLAAALEVAIASL